MVLVAPVLRIAVMAACAADSHTAVLNDVRLVLAFDVGHGSFTSPKRTFALLLNGSFEKRVGSLAFT